MLTPLNRPMYQNCVIQDHDGKMLCRSSQRRAEWYLSRGLADKVGEDPFTVRLKFPAKGHGDQDNEYMLSERVNRCVVCGTESDLTRHHVVPYSYRVHFPSTLKAKSSYDVLPVCVPCHVKYEVHAHEFRKVINTEMSVPESMYETDREASKVKVAAITLKRYGDKLPQERRETIEADIKEHFKVDAVTEEVLDKALQLEWRKNLTGFSNSCQMVVSKVMCLDSFIRRWRMHFLDTMKPQFMPEKWDPYYCLTTRTLDSQ